MAAPHSLRPAVPGDEPFLRTLYAESRAEELAPLNWDAAAQGTFLNSQFDLQRVHYERHHPDSRHEIVLVDGQAAGRIWVDVAGDSLQLIDLSLSTAIRGQGVGGALLRDLQIEARSLALPITLFVMHGNDRAKRFYARLGFAEFEDIGSHMRMRWEPA